MKERPILFSGEMVRAILDGRKTQTRRAIKPQPNCVHDNHRWVWLKEKWVDCPYGQPDDRLWVRETFCDLGAGTIPGRILYRASFNDLDLEMFHQSGHGSPIWKPSIFMPRWASRILLEITNIRIERVQDIPEEDAYSEGVFCHTCYGVGLQNDNEGLYCPTCDGSNIKLFHSLWDAINEKRGFGWDANPWVWIIEFKRIDNG